MRKLLGVLCVLLLLSLPFLLTFAVSGQSLSWELTWVIMKVGFVSFLYALVVAVLTFAALTCFFGR